MTNPMGSNLKLMVLKVLDQESTSGYGIVNKIEEKTGWKPSYGSIYPLLEEMNKEGLVDYEEKGRSKIYSLTSKGEKEIESWDEKREELCESMKENMCVIQELTGKDMGPVIELMDRFKKDEDPLKSLNPEFLEFRNKIFKMAFEGKAQENSEEIKQMLKDNIRKLEAME